jgi:hypothetical protein
LAGMYQCIAMNGVGNPATATIQLRILCEYHLKGICYLKVMLNRTSLTHSHEKYCEMFCILYK